MYGSREDLLLLGLSASRSCGTPIHRTDGLVITFGCIPPLLPAHVSPKRLHCRLFLLFADVQTIFFWRDDLAGCELLAPYSRQHRHV